MSIEYRPTTGVGRFEADLVSQALRIKHRLAIISNAAKPVSVADLGVFEQSFRNLVTAHWEQKFMFQRAGLTVRPTFELEFLAPDRHAEAHFVVNLSDSAGGTESDGRDPAHVFRALGDAAPRSTSFMTGSVNQPNSAQLIANDLPKIFPFYVDFYANGMSQQTRSQVESLMKMVARVTPQPTIYVTAYGQGASGNQQTLKTLLRQWGLTNVHSRSSNKVFLANTWGKSSTSKMSGRTNYAKISTKDDLDTQSFLAQTAVFSYPATRCT